MNNSAPRQQLPKAHKPKQSESKATSKSNEQLKLRTANSKKPSSDDPVNSDETLRRNQKGYS